MQLHLRAPLLTRRGIFPSGDLDSSGSHRAPLKRASVPETTVLNLFGGVLLKIVLSFLFHFFFLGKRFLICRFSATEMLGGDSLLAFKGEINRHINR